MKTKSFFLIIAFFLSASPRQNLTAATVLDSFSSGSFSLSDSGSDTDTDLITDGLFDERWVMGHSMGNFNATLAPENGMMTYGVSLRANPTRGELLVLFYSNLKNRAVNLTGATGFTLDVTGLLGSGEILVSLNGTSRFATPVPITSAGVFFYPMENTGNIIPLDSVNQVSIQLIATSADFSITLDRIAVVPEPSTGLLLGLGGWFLFWKRRVLRGPETGRTIFPELIKA